MKIRTLQARIVLAFTLLLLLIQAAGLFIINAVLTDSTNLEMQQNLLAGQRVFDLEQEATNRQLIQSSSIMSSDFAFRQAIATADYGTLISTLNNHGARIRANVMLLVDVDRKLIADTRQAGGAVPAGKDLQPFQYPELIALAEEQQQVSAMVMLDGVPYQVVVVPVLAPMPIAWVVVGFVIDDNFARDLRSVTGLEVSFLSREVSANRWRMLATTLPAGISGAIPQKLPSQSNKRSDEIITVSIDNDDYMTLMSGRESWDSRHIVIVLQRSLHQAMEPLRRLQVMLLILGGLSMLATLAASYRIARGITKPVSELSQLAGRIQQGDYSQAAPVTSADEIGNLASAFNNMREGLASREARITELAYRDQLSGLPNRTLFQDRLEQTAKLAKRTEQKFSLLIINLDRFKDVNNILGHHIGDLLLLEISKRLATTLARESDMLARLGGDEFAMLLPNVDAQGAMVVVRKILDKLDEPILLEGQEMISTGSIGIAVFPDHGEEINTLLRHADIAMHDAKHNNSKYAMFGPHYVEPSQQQLSLLAELRHAIARNEFVLYYQPKVTFATGIIGHVEALARWIHPVRGMVPPDKFIPYAEHTGYISTITSWVIEEALRQRKQWEEMRLPLSISVNISTRDLMDGDFPELLVRLMEKYGASPHWIRLEITESAIMGDPKRAMDVIEELHRHGFSLSIDDFGTGYSSLAYLKKLQVSELKIDKSFVIHMADDKDDAIIVRSTIDLAHNMGLTVVAEGVENQISWDMLNAMGCDLAQGYFISRPVAVDALIKWLAQAQWKVVKAA